LAWIRLLILLGHKSHRSNRGTDSQSAAPALMPADRGRAKQRVKTSLDPAGKGPEGAPRATGLPAVCDPVVLRSRVDTRRSKISTTIEFALTAS
jgi:hypothetical protein